MLEREGKKWGSRESKEDRETEKDRRESKLHL